MKPTLEIPRNLPRKKHILFKKSQSHPEPQKELPRPDPDQARPIWLKHQQKFSHPTKLPLDLAALGQKSSTLHLKHASPQNTPPPAPETPNPQETRIKKFIPTPKIHPQKIFTFYLKLPRPIQGIDPIRPPQKKTQ